MRQNKAVWHEAMLPCSCSMTANLIHLTPFTGQSDEWKREPKTEF